MCLGSGCSSAVSRGRALTGWISFVKNAVVARVGLVSVLGIRILVRTVSHLFQSEEVWSCLKNKGIALSEMRLDFEISQGHRWGRAK